MFATWCAYLVFALGTDWRDYGLVEQPGSEVVWVTTRLTTVTSWLLLAAALIRLRHQRSIVWRSFLSAFGATTALAIMISPSVVSAEVSHLAILGSIACYALVSGFLCITVDKPAIAALLGLLLFAAQSAVDTGAHLASGIFRLH
jgi:hypothetical protein